MLEHLEIDPGDAESWLLLGQWRADRGQGEGAREALDRALALAPDDASIQARAGTTLEWIGDREGALVRLAEALRRGYRVEVLTGSPGLARLRADPRFQELLQRYPPAGGHPTQSHASPGGRS